jgi:acid stress chaperone HdeB
MVTHTRLIATLMFVQLAAVTHARAEIKIDVSKLSCKDFMVPTFILPDDIAYWLSGFYNGRHGNTVIDVIGLRDYVTKVQQYCTNHQEETVMKAAENVSRASP